MQLTHQDHNITRDLFKTDSVNVMKNRSLVAEKQRKFQYILAWLSLSVCEKPLKNLMIWKYIGLMLLVM